MRNIIKIVFSLGLILVNLLGLTACQKHSPDNEKALVQEQQVIKQLKDFLEPVDIKPQGLPGLTLHHLANPFEVKKISQPMSSLSSFLNKSWKVQGYVKHGGAFSGVFISSETDQMLLLPKEILFDASWRVKAVNLTKVTLMNTKNRKIVSKLFFKSLGDAV